MRDRLRLIVLGPAIAATLALSAAQHGSAMSKVNSTTITLSPAIINQEIIPSSTIDQIVRITNNSGFNYSYSVRAVPYNISGENYLPIFKAVSGTVDTTRWFNFPSTQGLLPANGSLSIPYKIAVPSNIRPGGYYAAVLVKVTPLKPNSSGNVIAINQQLAEILFMYAPGPLSTSGHVVSWQFSLLQSRPIKGLLRFKNTGTIYYFTDTSINIRNITNKLKYSNTLQHVVLPGTIRAIGITWPKSPSYGLYKISGQVDWGKNTINLPTRYVLVATDSIRVAIGVFILIGLIILTRIGIAVKKNRRKKP